MLRQGLEKEVKALVKKYGWTPVLRNTIGYAEWSSFAPEGLRKDKSSFAPNRIKGLQKDKSSHTEELQKIAEQIKTHTLQLTKRQMTWFKRDKTIRWVKDYKEAADLIKKFTETESL